MLKKTCPECQTINVMEESQFQPGETVKIECQLCGTEIEVIIPDKVEDQVPSTALEVVEVPVAEVVEPVPTEKDIELLRLSLELERLKQQRQKELVQQPVYQIQPSVTPVSSKSKTTAGLLALFLGGFGIHKFYLGRYVQGIFYLLFCWTYIPGIIAFFEAISYFVQDSESFAEKYH